MSENNDEKLGITVNSVVQMLGNRVSSFVIIGLCTWILTNVSDLKGDVRDLIATMRGQDTRIANLESWRNEFDAYAADVGGKHR